MPTPDRRAGPLEEEEIQFEDRGPGGEDPGDPVVTGALRRINDKLYFKEAAAVAQVLKARNFPVGFADVDLAGVSDGKVLAYDDPTKTFKPVFGFGSFDVDIIMTDDITHDVLVDDVLGHVLVNE